MLDDLTSSLGVPKTLEDRTLCRVAPNRNVVREDGKNQARFVLYLPTVLLRKRQNPAFALACRIANFYQVPLIVLCTILDDQHLTREPLKPICMTARRLCFTIEALQSCAVEWEKHGAGVAVRIHGPGARRPHHLTLARHAVSVVCDEPFVEPFRTYVRRVVNSCRASNIPCFSVDGSTTVPPKSVLRALNESPVPGDRCFEGVPTKAWIWEKQTSLSRIQHVNSALKDHELDAPPLQVKLPTNFFMQYLSECDAMKMVTEVMPSEWNVGTPCPGDRPWTVEELLLVNPNEWVMTSWPGADRTVPPCKQTSGSFVEAEKRWRRFVEHGLKDYAKHRNQITLPNAVSRISCYLNLGILSIFEVVSDVWKAKSNRGYSAGCNKFLVELIKWREIGYVHSFATPGYINAAEVIPDWAYKSLQGKRNSSQDGAYTWEQLETGTTSDENWNAMQRYLIETGELHNNARMPWGKTVVHWQSNDLSPEEVLWQLVQLNDRFALDGLSPPSYAGILWCFGWDDKPGSGGTVKTKWASRYRYGPSDFDQAKNSLYGNRMLTWLQKRELPKDGDNNTTSSKKSRPSQDITPERVRYFDPGNVVKIISP